MPVNDRSIEMKMFPSLGLDHIHRWYGDCWIRQALGR